MHTNTGDRDVYLNNGLPNIEYAVLSEIFDIWCKSDECTKWNATSKYTSRNGLPPSLIYPKPIRNPMYEQLRCGRASDDESGLCGVLSHFSSRWK